MKRFLLLANPRTGSTYLANLLRSHADIGLAGELLNDEHIIPEDALKYISKELAKYDQKFVGFKVFPEQILKRKLRFDDIVRHIGADVVIVLWRKSIAEQLVSLRIAEKTGVWFEGAEDYNNNKNNRKNGKEKTIILDQELSEYYENLVNDWRIIGSQWPIDIIPIYVSYDDLITDPLSELRKIMSRLSCDMEQYVFTSPGAVKQQTPPSDRIENWEEISDDLKILEINVKQLMTECIENNLNVKCQALPYVPDPEPPFPSKGWRYNVCAPYMPNEGKDNVIQALVSGSVSSAGFWPKEMSDKLRKLYDCPVAQPCSNGFTALMVVLQAMHVGSGDEVIMPSMTMVAVPNSVTFVGAVPVFADCADGDYNPGLKEILEVASERTRAVVLTHTYGVPTPEVEIIAKECRQRKWILIEDISECVGVSVRTKSSGNQLLGTFGDFGCASLYANKIIHGGDGGFIVAKDAILTARLKALVNHGFTPNYHFLHFESAINAKINGLGAALVCGCLDRMSAVLYHRQLLSQWYRQYLKSLPIELMPECGPSDTPWVFGIVCPSKRIRRQLRAYLAEYGVESRDFFYPLHFQPAFRHISTERRYPRAESLGSTGFYLPTYYDLRQIDVKYICDVIREYFSGKTIDLIAPGVESNDQLVIRSGTFSVEALSLSRCGQVKQRHSRGHPFIEAIQLNITANKCLIHESWDSCQKFIQSVDNCVKATESMGLNPKIVEKYFQPYVEYFKTQSAFEAPLQRPWTSEDLSAPEYAITRNVSTTTDYETQQLLVWIIKQFKPKCMLELGSWMGYSTLLMAISAKTYQFTHHKSRIYACDSYVWQKWMSHFVITKNVMANGDTFLPRFLFNTEPMSEYIEPVVMDFDTILPDTVSHIKPDFVFIDFTQDGDEIQEKWTHLEPNLIPGKTIVLFNGLSITSIPFFTKNSDRLKALVKPHSIAKAFIYSPDMPVQKPLKNINLSPKFNFQTPPDWDHHYKNAFNSCVDILRQEFHDKESNILFIPSVEGMLCDNSEVMRNNDWIGIIHMTPEYPELFYTPDLKRLCSNRYKQYMKTCKGLFTLTSLQKQYLDTNLELDYKIAIQTLVYPYIEPEVSKDSEVIDLLQNNETVELILIGGFARDLNCFYSANVSKQFKKVILINDLTTEYQLRNDYPKDIELKTRLADEEYERQLYRSIPFLTLLHNGAANTLILECIARNIPILVPNMSSCTEYIGEDYPLLYSRDQKDFTNLLTIESIQSAIDYLKTMDKNRFKTDYFFNSVKTGIVLQSLSTKQSTNSELSLQSVPDFCEFDVSVCICSFKRTHHLPQILDSLWSGQTFKGRLEIIVWNNNYCRKSTVSDICRKYMIESNEQKSLQLINSSKNYFCSVRLAMPQLMQSQRLLICDDDCIPGPQFIDFFMTAHTRHPEDVLCLRGHKFLEHKLDAQNPTNVWLDYENLRFVSDDRPEDLIHFVHADTCLIPRKALQECASIPVPDPCFALVDDYWMSYVLNHKFNRKLRKLSTNAIDLRDAIVSRTQDSDEIGLALYTRPEVKQNKIKLYIHHMLQGWPVWDRDQENDIKLDEKSEELLAKSKREFWDKLFVGFNISSEISEESVRDLVEMGVKCVRIGAVGLGDKVDYELKGFVANRDQQMRQLKTTISLLKSNGIRVVLTLYRQLSSPEIWEFIAKNLYSEENVVGYDLINEPFTPLEEQYEFVDNDLGLSELMSRYIQMIESIRKVDKITPIIIESSYWATVDAIPKLSIENLLTIDTNILVSFHFYEPMLLTQRQRNKNRFAYPSQVPDYENIKYPQMIEINDNYIANKFLTAIQWSQKFNVRLVLGEFGISREVLGADLYLGCIMKLCKTHAIPAFIYSFRDEDWDSMDYELGDNISNGKVKQILNQNILMQTILSGINETTV